jgi:NADH-quinone oxidoreductase subunit L
MEQSVNYLGLIPLFPLLGAVIIGLLHVFTCKRTRLPEKIYGILAALDRSCLCACSQGFCHLKALPPEARFLIIMPSPGSMSVIFISPWAFWPIR